MTASATKTKKENYPKPNQNPSFPKIEEEVLKFWQENNIFEKSIEQREPGESGNKSSEFVFYDGPPFANGLPHYGHLLAGYVKDTFARYQTMQGNKVERRFGWDCHGLPAEMGVEKESGISGKKAIEDYGIGNFNKLCGESVVRYVTEWKDYVNRSGRWVDFDGGYKTMDLNYMESVMWVFKQLYDKGLLYEDYRVMPYSWMCQTPLSNFETKMDNSYRERADKAITIKFELDNNFCHSELDSESKNCKLFNEILKQVQDDSKSKDVKIALLAWTTTPWTLPSNLALTIGEDIDYVLIEKDGEYIILGKAALNKYKKELAVDDEGNFKILREFKGKDMLSWKYRPLLPYLSELKEIKKSDRTFTIISADFVTTEDGTGIVHTAPGFGEDDQLACKKYGIPTVCPVDEKGCFTSEISDYAGEQVFETNDKIIIRLKEEGKWLKTEQILHNYPHCWRTDTPLIYKAMSSWYVKVTDLKDKIIENNQQINWIPGHVKDGQFGKWLEGARDWSITRNRYWGCPVPVWKSDDPKYPRVDVYGSLDELEKDFGVRPTNLHRPYIDELTRPNPDDPTGKSTMRRVTDVLDCWFESGSMPYAQFHYPFENKEWFEKHFPADFISEGIGQVRGWFYTLLVLSTALFDKPAYKNVIGYGTVLDEEGKKLSKRWRNYVDPADAFNIYGSDAMRWLMISSPALTGQDLRIDKHGKDMKETVRLAIKPIWNAYNFFCLYANSDGIKAERYFTDLKLETGNNEKLVKDVQNVRHEVFVKGQGIPEKDDVDGLDGDSNQMHYVLYKGNKPIATMRICLKEEGKACLQKFAVLQEYRGKGVGKHLMQQVMLNLARKKEIKTLGTPAQAYLKNFYMEFGFGGCGKEFEECGIKHLGMKRDNLTETEIEQFSKENFLKTSSNLMDIYILSKLKQTVEAIEEGMSSYMPQSASRQVEDFFEVLNNWYIRRSRNRFWKTEKDEDKQEAYNTLYTCLLTMCEAIAPLMPYTTEAIWRGLKEGK